MSTITVALATRVLARPLTDLYQAGKDRFATRLARWQGAAAQKQLAQKISVMEKVKTFWRSDKSVPLSNFYYPNKVTFGRKARPFAVSSLAALPREGNFVVQGTIGQGKSIFLRHLCVQELTESGTQRIPIFIELRTLTEKGLVSEIRETVRTLGFDTDDSEIVDFYLRTGKLVLLLDAFDELDESLITKTVADIDRLATTYEQLQMFVTARPQSAIEHSRHFQVIRLVPLRPPDHEPFLRRIGLNPKEAKNLLAATRAGSSRIHTLLSTPLILTLLVVVYQSEQTIPEELPEFYQKLFQTLFSKHDSAKPGFKRQHKSGLSERRLQQLFQAFCFSVLQLKFKTTLKQSEFNTCFDRAVVYTNISCELEGFKHDIVKVTCLMQEEGYDIQFLHKSVLEFFAAAFITERAEDGARKFYEQVLTGAWHPWNQVLSFLSQIDRYRFLKYFEIPCADSVISTLGITVDPGSELDAAALARTMYDEVKYNLERNMSGGYEISSFGPFGMGRFRVAQDLDDPLLARFVDDKTTNEAVAKIVKESRPVEREISLAWNVLFSEQEMVEITAEVVDKTKKILRERMENLKYIATEDARAEMLQI